MARFYHLKKRNGKRMFIRRRRKAAYRGRRRVSNSQGVLIPMRTFTTLKYAQDFELKIPAQAGLIDRYQFRANSIFDPDYALGGHQPMGRDQYANFYQKYMVVSSTITATFRNTSNSSLTSDTNQQYVVGIVTTTPNQIISNNLELLENNRTSYGFTSPQKPFTRISKNFNAKKFWGLSRVLDNSDYGAVMGTNPLEECLFEIFGYNPIGSENPTPLFVNIMIKYNCVLRDRVNLGLS